MEFVPGQLVIWRYKHCHKLRSQPSQTCFVTGEIVQPGRLRVRIRVRKPDGVAQVRWVKPANLCLARLGEPTYFYPEA